MHETRTLLTMLFPMQHSGGLSVGTSLSPHKPPPMWADIRRWKEVAILGACDSLAFRG